MSVYQLKRSQVIHAPVDEVWNFIATPLNLSRITPPSMGFKILSGTPPEEMYAGMIITYRVSPLAGIPVKWVTEITHVESGRYFVDEQRYGPYRMWHHQHHIEAHEAGTLMHDTVTYRPPFGLLGDIANSLFIRRMLEGIFDYRTTVIKELYPET